MNKGETMGPTQVKKEVKTLAFTIKKVAGDLYADQIIKIADGRIIGVKTGTGTSFGHATCEAGDLLTHFHLYEFERGVDSFYESVKMI